MSSENYRDDETAPNMRGVSNLEEARTWLQARNIGDIECVVPDIAGVPRGKMMPTKKVLQQ